MTEEYEAPIQDTPFEDSVPSTWSSKKKLLLTVVITAGLLISLGLVHHFFLTTAPDGSNPRLLTSIHTDDRPPYTPKPLTRAQLNQSDIKLDLTKTQENRTSLACIMRILYHLNLPARDPLKSEGCESRTRDLIDFVNKMATERKADISDLDYISMEWVNASAHVSQILRDIRFLENSPKGEFLVKYRYVDYDNNNKDVLQELPNDQGILDDKYKAVAMMALTDPSREPKAVCGVQSVYLRHLDEEHWIVINDHIGSVMENVPTADLQPKQFEVIIYQRIQEWNKILVSTWP